MTNNVFHYSLLDAFIPKNSTLRTGDAWGTGANTPATPQAPSTIWGSNNNTSSTASPTSGGGWCGMTGGLGNESAAKSTNNGWCGMTGGLGNEKKDTWCGMTGGLGNKSENNGGGNWW